MNPFGAWWGLLPTLWWMGSWLPTYVAHFFPSSREKISQPELNCQPLHLEVGTSPLSPGSLRSSHRRAKKYMEMLFKDQSPYNNVHVDPNHLMIDSYI